MRQPRQQGLGQSHQFCLRRNTKQDHYRKVRYEGRPDDYPGPLAHFYLLPPSEYNPHPSTCVTTRIVGCCLQSFTFSQFKNFLARRKSATSLRAASLTCSEGANATGPKNLK